MRNINICVAIIVITILACVASMGDVPVGFSGPRSIWDGARRRAMNLKAVDSKKSVAIEVSTKEVEFKVVGEGKKIGLVSRLGEDVVLVPWDGRDLSSKER